MTVGAKNHNLKKISIPKCKPSAQRIARGLVSFKRKRIGEKN